MVAAPATATAARDAGLAVATPDRCRTDAGRRARPMPAA